MRICPSGGSHALAIVSLATSSPDRSTRSIGRDIGSGRSGNPASSMARTVVMVLDPPDMLVTTASVPRRGTWDPMAV